MNPVPAYIGKRVVDHIHFTGIDIRYVVGPPVGRPGSIITDELVARSRICSSDTGAYR
ncbi:hypothetical protein D3C73_498440 [compost metagenome]